MFLTRIFSLFSKKKKTSETTQPNRRPTREERLAEAAKENRVVRRKTNS